MVKGNQIVERKGNQLGGWAFLIGVLLAVIFGLFSNIGTNWVWVLVVIGLIVGFLNITEKETGSFLMSGAVLIIASAFGGNILGSISYVNLENIFNMLLAIFIPATIIVAIKHSFALARN